MPKPRLPHRKYASLIKRYYKHLSVAREVEEQLQEIMRASCPSGVNESAWEEGAIDTFKAHDRVDMFADYPPTLAEAFKEALEVLAVDEEDE